jgi:hypothetical protein
MSDGDGNAVGNLVDPFMLRGGSSSTRPLKTSERNERVPPPRSVPTKQDAEAPLRFSDIQEVLQRIEHDGTLGRERIFQGSQALEYLQRSGIDLRFLAVSPPTTFKQETTPSPAMRKAISEGKRAFWDGDRLYLLWYKDPGADSRAQANELIETLREGAALAQARQNFPSASASPPSESRSQSRTSPRTKPQPPATASTPAPAKPERRVRFATPLEADASTRNRRSASTPVLLEEVVENDPTPGGVRTKDDRRRPRGENGNTLSKPSVRFTLRNPLPSNAAVLREGYASLEQGAFMTDDVISELFDDWNRYNREHPPAPGEPDAYFVTPVEMRMLSADPSPALDPENPAVVSPDLLAATPHPILVLPVNLEENHWTAAVYDRRTGMIRYADSSFSPNHAEHAEAAMSNIYARDPYPGRPEQGTFLSCRVPQQQNGYSCGDHILGTAQGIQNKRNGANPHFRLEDSVPFDRATLRSHLVSHNPDLRALSNNQGARGAENRSSRGR